VNVVLLSGGVGGARFARGLHGVLGKGELTIVGNVGDDLDVLGLTISPDLDSILYTLAGLGDDERGWGREGETWRALASVKAWGGEDWFLLGDLDLGLHLVRTQALREGLALSEITAHLVQRARLGADLLPATDDRLRTYVVTPSGTFAFQEWFVERGHRDEVDDVVFEGAQAARPAPGVLEAFARADAILIAPSNPYVSIAPILAVSDIRAAIEARQVRSVAVSPVIRGKAVKGPVDRMLLRMAGGTAPAHVAGCYEGLIDALVVDDADVPAEVAIPLVVTQTLMSDASAARRLAEVVLDAACG
jgi:LPPG:FO 2-phospho-L-lactate transferase